MDKPIALSLVHARGVISDQLDTYSLHKLCWYAMCMLCSIKSGVYLIGGDSLFMVVLMDTAEG